MRHSTAHVMAEAVLDLFPGAKLGIGPAIDNGFYYDFELPRAAHARRPRGDRGPDGRERQGRPPVRAQGGAVRRGAGDRRGRGPGVQGRDPRRPRGQRPRLPGNRRRSRPSTSTARSATCAAAPTSSRRGRSARSSCSPSPVPTGAATRSARVDAAHLRHGLGDAGGARPIPVAARGGQEARPPPARRAARPVQLPRRRARVGVLAPQGLALWQTLRGAMRELQERRGYEEIYTPPLVHQKLWQQSGHWALYRDNMYLVDVEGQCFSLKPMNCPESSFIYRSRLRSYRDLPLRLSEYGVLHRNELSGVLSGLTRVRHFVTDDAHIYVRPDQIAAEIEALMGEIRESYGWFGLSRRSRSARVRTRPWVTRRCGRRPRRSCGGARQVRPPVPGQGKGRRVLCAQARHPDRRMPWAGNGRRRPSRSTA